MLGTDALISHLLRCGGGGVVFHKLILLVIGSQVGRKQCDNGDVYRPIGYTLHIDPRLSTQCPQPPVVLRDLKQSRMN